MITEEQGWYNRDRVEQWLRDNPTQFVAMQKKPGPVLMRRLTLPFQVQTNEGVLTGQAGDYLAYDPVSRHVWPVSAEYVAMHYEEYQDDEEEA